MDWTKEQIFAVDLETTGLDPVKDRIVQMAIVRFEAGKPWRKMEAWVSLFGTDVPMSPGAVMVSRIDPNELSGRPHIEAKMESILNILQQGKIFLGYNALRFDVLFLKEAHKRAGCKRPLPFLPKNTIDPLVFARALYDKARGWKLAQMAARLGVRTDRSHDALGDSLVAAEVMVRMAVSNDLPTDLTGLINLQERYIREWEERRR